MSRTEISLKVNPHSWMDRCSGYPCTTSTDCKTEGELTVQMEGKGKKRSSSHSHQPTGVKEKPCPLPSCLVRPYLWAFPSSFFLSHLGWEDRDRLHRLPMSVWNATCSLKWRRSLLGQTILVRTRADPIRSLLNQPTLEGRRLARWSLSQNSNLLTRRAIKGQWLICELRTPRKRMGWDSVPFLPSFGLLPKQWSFLPSGFPSLECRMSTGKKKQSPSIVSHCQSFNPNLSQKRQGDSVCLHSLSH